MDEQNVANTEVKETPQLEPTPVETTETVTTDVGAVAKETPKEPSDRFDKHPRFQELNRKAKEADEYKRKYEEMLSQKPEPVESDIYTGMTPEEKTQTQSFISKYVMPEVEKKYAPFVQTVQTERLNKQIDEAKGFADKFGINFDERLPEITEFLSRQENRGRLTAKEAFLTMYSDDIVNASRNMGKEEISKEQRELMEKKKQANMQTTTVSQGSVVHSDAMAKKQLSDEEKVTFDINRAIEAVRGGHKSSKVKE